jgi:hypothetical protein
MPKFPDRSPRTKSMNLFRNGSSRWSALTRAARSAGVASGDSNAASGSPRLATRANAMKLIANNTIIVCRMREPE